LEPWSVQLSLQNCEEEPLNDGDGRSDELRVTIQDVLKISKLELEAPLLRRKALLALMISIHHLKGTAVDPQKHFGKQYIPC
jgi:hypothetical protein